MNDIDFSKLSPEEGLDLILDRLSKSDDYEYQLPDDLHKDIENWIDKYELLHWETNGGRDRYMAGIALTKKGRDIVAFGGFKAFLKALEAEARKEQEDKEYQRKINKAIAEDIENAIKRSIDAENRSIKAEKWTKISIWTAIVAAVLSLAQLIYNSLQ